MEPTAIPRKALQALAVFSVGAFAFIPALAQEPVIIVDIKAIADQVAQNIEAEESKIPLTVQAPIHVAAEVCGVPATVLGTQGGSSGAVGCAATATSPELEKIVRTKIRKESQAQ